MLEVDAPGVLLDVIDPDEDALTAVLASEPAHGALSLQANGAFVYTPETNFHGMDSFAFFAFDGEWNSRSILVSLEVQPLPDAPLAVDDAYSTSEDVPLIIDADQGLFSQRLGCGWR